LAGGVFLVCGEWRIWVLDEEKLGLIGFVLPEPEGVVYFHNPLL